MLKEYYLVGINCESLNKYEVMVHIIMKDILKAYIICMITKVPRLSAHSWYFVQEGLRF